MGHVGVALAPSHQASWNPNIQRVRTQVKGATKRVNVCTSCIKAGKIVKAG